MKNELKEALGNFLKSKSTLEKYYGGRKLTNFGDVGELIAANLYNLKLCETKNEKGYDGVDEFGRQWQIKASFTESRTNINCPKLPVFGYLALKIHEDGTVEEVYNGPWETVLKDYQNSDRISGKYDAPESRSIIILKRLNATVPDSQKLPSLQ